MSSDPLISRRSLLLRGAFVAGAAIAAPSLLSACAPAATTTSPSGVTKLTFLEPGDPPADWSRVLAAVNKKLEKDVGLQLDVQWIGWSNYSDAELLKFTSGEKFTGALEADWLHMSQFAQDGVLLPLDDELTEDKYPNLIKTIDPLTYETSKLDGKLWGIPQVNAAGFILGFMTRKDLGNGAITDFNSLERYLYDVKQKNSSVIPYGMDNGYVNNAQEYFNAAVWEGAGSKYMQIRLSDRFPLLFISVDDARAGRARVLPVWENEEVMDTFHRVRKYYNDGIINHDALNVDKKTVYGLFGQGKFASAIGVTDGLMTTTYGATRENVSGAELELIFPFSDRSAARPFSVFGSSNHMVFNAASDQLVDGLRFQEWLSVQENHDLLQYGIEGKDWKLMDDGSYEQTSKYVFPGYTMSWRVPLERMPADMIESEREWYGWAQKFESFELSPLAGFEMAQDPVKSQLAQFNSLVSKHIRPLQAGTVDVDQGMDALKKGFTSAGLDKVAAETEKQLNEFFAKRG